MDNLKIGSIIHFDRFEWRVLDIKENKALLITEQIIEQRPYSLIYKDITWAECSLRAYLNKEFYEAFSPENQAKIISVVNKNPDNPWFNTIGGVDTEDKIFLLSLSEVVCQYFGDSSANLYNKSNKQRYWFQKKDKNNEKRIARLADETNWKFWWWIRTPGRFNKKAIYIHGDGNIGIQGNHIKIGNAADGKCLGGVRPALWIKLD